MDLQTKRTKTHLSVTVAVGRDRKIRMAWRTNQIAEFVAVSFWKKNKTSCLNSYVTSYVKRLFHIYIITMNKYSGGQQEFDNWSY